jgi:hypothetical protein
MPYKTLSSSHCTPRTGLIHTHAIPNGTTNPPNVRTRGGVRRNGGVDRAEYENFE